MQLYHAMIFLQFFMKAVFELTLKLISLIIFERVSVMVEAEVFTIP